MTTGFCSPVLWLDHCSGSGVSQRFKIIDTTGRGRVGGLRHAGRVRSRAPVPRLVAWFGMCEGEMWLLLFLKPVPGAISRGQPKPCCRVRSRARAMKLARAVARREGVKTIERVWQPVSPYRGAAGGLKEPERLLLALCLGTTSST